MADFDPNARMQGAYAQEARRNTGDAMAAQGNFLQDYMQQARSGENSVAQQQLQAGLNQGMRGMQAQAAAGGSNPLAQRAAMYSGGQMMGQANSQAAMMRAAEMQQAQQMYNQHLGQNTQLRFGQEGLQFNYDQGQRQSELQGEQLRQAQQQADRKFGMDIAGAVMGAAGSAAMMSDERAKVVVPPGRPAGMSDLQALQIGREPMMVSASRPAGRPEGMSDLQAPHIGGTLVVPEIQEDPAMTRELAREGVYDLPRLEQMTAREVTRENPLTMGPPQAEPRSDTAGNSLIAGTDRLGAGLKSLARADVASGAPPMSVLPPGYADNGYAMGERGIGVEGIDGRIERLGFGEELGRVTSDVDMKQPVSSDEKDKKKAKASIEPRNPEMVDAMASPYRAEHTDRYGQRYGIPDGYGQAPVRLDPGLREYARPGLVPNVRLEEEPPPFNMEQEARDAEAREMARSVVPYRYDYKPGRGLPEGEQTGIMAQDLARSDMGRNMVEEGPDGALRVDAGQAALSSLGAAGAQQREIDRLNQQVSMLQRYLQSLGA